MGEVTRRRLGRNEPATVGIVALDDHDLPASLLSEHIVFRSPLVQSPIAGGR
ncbi:MAG: hypothetical protein ACLQDM_21965 [Bradyrhizobium sp.]